MTTFAIKEFKARASAILRDLSAGDSVVITRHGKPCAKVTGLAPAPHESQPLTRLKGIRSNLAEVPYDEFLALKRVWGPRPLESAERTAEPDE